MYIFSIDQNCGIKHSQSTKHPYVSVDKILGCLDTLEELIKM